MALRKLSVYALAGLLAAGLVASGCGSGGVGGREIVVEGPVTVARSFEQGDVFKYKFKVDSQSGVKRTAYEQTISVQTELKTTSTITKADAEEVEMKMRFDYAVGGITMGDQMQSDESVSSLRGKELVFGLDHTGKVLSWGGLAGEAALEAGAGQLAMLLYEVFPPLPDEPLSVGVTWTVPYDVPDITSAVDREFVGEKTYTVTGFKEKYEIECVVVHSVTSFEFEGRAEQAGEVWLMSGEGVGEGNMLISLKDGVIVYSSGEATMTLSGEGASVASAAASGTVEMGVKSRLVIELI
jgi:hypothetical protein